MRRIISMFLVLVAVAVGALAEPEADALVLDIDGTNYLSVVHRELGAATVSNPPSNTLNRDIVRQPEQESA